MRLILVAATDSSCDGWFETYDQSTTSRNLTPMAPDTMTWIFLSNKSTEREKSHHVVTRYVISLSYFESGDKKNTRIRHLVTAGDWIFLG